MSAPKNRLPEGGDDSNGVTLWEAYWPDTPYRLHVEVKRADAFLTLKGARHLQKRLAAAIKRLEQKPKTKKK